MASESIHIVVIKDCVTKKHKQFCLHSYDAMQLWRELHEHKYEFDWAFTEDGYLKENPQIWSEFPHHPSGREPMVYQWNYLRPYNPLNYC